ncbi:hypothetical protein P4N68_01745 [Corynebacterium felinum]|uniref:DUF559 domain-containing protein n=1 Tax=Corynebacterium felinum TaxID=131318 RepID=A0ABU2BBR5_9CORY|nr:hypothetical protein [Corynebacterium felinum]MDF5819803.1 hypothetical protein [Corynebacterium felinum]MDR7356056.1 hypothetical protein [Corynebacterium felinum]
MSKETSYLKAGYFYRNMRGLVEHAALLQKLVYLRNVEPHRRCVRFCPTWGLYSSDYASLLPSVRNVLRCFAIALSRKSAVLSGEAAACVLGIPFLENNKLMKTVTVTLPGRMKPPARNQRGEHVTYSSRLLPPEDIVIENGIRVTSISRTFLDFVASGSKENALSFIEAAFYQKRTSKARVARDLKNMPKLAGKPDALALLSMARENSESLYETKARYMIEVAEIFGVESIETQAVVAFTDTTYRIDILINGFLGIEIDGRSKTKNNPEALIEERIREKRIQNRGYVMIRYHPDELTSGFISDIFNLLHNHQKLKAA